MKLKRNLVLIAAALLLIGSFFLPNAVAGITDLNRLDNMVMIDSQSISFDSVAALRLPERIELVANSDAESMMLNSGNRMDEETAGNRAIRELNRFFRGGLFEFEFHACSIEECTASFIIDTATPTINMIIWELTLVDTYENTAIVTIDDELGVIIRMIYKQGRRNQNTSGTNNSLSANLTDEELHNNALNLSELMAKYYTMPVILGDYYYSSSLSYSYYRADITDEGHVIPMYGVVRSTGFTMNERV